MKFSFLILILSLGSRAMAMEPPSYIVPLGKAMEVAQQVHPGEVQSHEIEEDNGRWVYSFDIYSKDHVTYEVLIDAITGKFISQIAEEPPVSMPLLSGANDTDELPIQLKCLWASYRNFKIGPGSKNIILSNGQSLPYRSKVTTSSVDPNNLTSIDQMFYTPYPSGFTKTKHGGLSYATPTKKDILRASRYGRLFRYLYGNSPSAVESNLVTVRWLDGSRLSFNQRYGAARALKRTVNDLYNLAVDHPEIRKYLRRPIGGTFIWRRIAHTKNLSMHAFGAAIDINTRYSSYWRWEIGSNGIPYYHNMIPPSIAQVFENNGFIWGGKWYHYDTMHFEYRPEILMNHGDCERIFSRSYKN